VAQARASSEIRRTRREMHKELRPPGERPDPSLAITRRIFLHKSLLAGAGRGDRDLRVVPADQHP